MDNELNTKIENALKDKNIIKIINKASNRFRNTLDIDEIYSCQLNALWKAFVNFKPEKNTKFTTYLYQGVFIECLKQIKFKNKHSENKKILHDNFACKDVNHLLVDILDEIDSAEEKKLIVDNKIGKMTINEIAATQNVSRETIRKRIKKTIQKFKHKFI